MERTLMALEVHRTMNLFQNRYYNLNRWLLSFIGLWPYLKPKEKRFRRIMMNMVVVIAFITQMANAFNSKFDDELLINTSMFYLPFLCIVLMYYTGYFAENKLKRLTDGIMVDWKELKPEELNIVKQYAAGSRLLTKILMISFYTPFVLMFVLSAICYTMEDESSIFAYKYFYPMETYIDRTKYPYLNLCIVNIGIFLVGILSLATYAIYLMYVQHACALFRVIGYMMDQVIVEKEFDNPHLIKSDEVYSRIIRGIKYHKRAIEYTESINALSKLGYFFQAIIWFVIISVDLLGILKLNSTGESISAMIFCIMHMSCMICWLFFNCIIGQKLIDHSLIVFRKISDVPWYLLPPKIQMVAVILLMRSAKPCYLSIGEMFISSNEFFMSVLQTAVSYGMILHSL